MGGAIKFGFFIRLWKVGQASSYFNRQYALGKLNILVIDKVLKAMRYLEILREFSFFISFR